MHNKALENKKQKKKKPLAMARNVYNVYFVAVTVKKTDTNLIKTLHKLEVFSFILLFAARIGRNDTNSDATSLRGM